MMKNWAILGMIFVITMPAFSQIVTDQTQQTRALWVTRWDYRTERGIELVVENAVAHHFNVLFFQVRGNGTVSYPSQYEPWPREFGGKDPGWNPLQKAIEKAHQAGIQLHAWVNVYPGWRGTVPPTDSMQLYLRHPDWFMVDEMGAAQPLSGGYLWLSPTHPEVQNHLLDVFTEIYQNYDVDGLHLDYFRYPCPAYSYDSTSTTMFRNKMNATPKDKPIAWTNWRRASVTWLLQQLHMRIEAEKPEVVLSASVLGDYNTGRNVFFQDSHDWLVRGIIDAICPMIYVFDDTLFRKQLLAHRMNNHGRHVYPGLHLRQPSRLRNQMNILAEIGCPGVAIFSYGLLFPDHSPNKELLTPLDSIWTQATGPAAMPWKATIRDVDGPAIVEIRTFPQKVIAGQPFSVLAKMTDPSGVYDDETGSNGQGVYLVYERSQNLEIAGEMTMRPMKNAEDWYITDTKITPQSAGLDFRVRVFAYDDFHESVAHPKRNLGYSDLHAIPILLPEELYACVGAFGPPLWKPISIEVDSHGKVWVSENESNRVRIILPDGNEAPFSPLTFGQSPDGDSVRIGIPSGLALANDSIMCLTSNSNAHYIFRYHTETGRPLPGLQLSFAGGELDCNEEGYLFILQSSANRWHVLNVDGRELRGSPFGGGNTGWGIAVDPKVATVCITNQTHGIVERWVGAIEAGRARFWREDFPTTDVGFGKVKADSMGNFYICHTPRGVISVWHPAGRLLGHITGGNPPINAPRSIGVAPDGCTLYILETSGDGLTRLVKWEIVSSK